MPQLEPFYYINTIKITLISLNIMVWIYGGYIMPKILERINIYRRLKSGGL